MKKELFTLTIILVLISWQCSKDDRLDSDLTLKESIEESVSDINTAVDRISFSKGYQLLSVSEDGTKSEDGFHDSIDLDMIAGIYEFSPDPEFHPVYFFPYRLFRKTGPGTKLEVNLPEQMVFHPRRLHFYLMADSVLKNNFRITATDYHFYYNWWNNYDYILEADFSLNSNNIGNMKISSVWMSQMKRKYENRYSFPEGYSLTKKGQTGDNAEFMFALTHADDTLLKETLLFTGDGFKKKEKQYILSIGDVDIKRATGVDSIQVYLKGILQKKAGAKIMNNEDFNASVFSRRDILLTFDDGTQAKLSELISPSLETLKTLSRSLDEIYVSKHIIDYIAFNIYYCRQ